MLTGALPSINVVEAQANWTIRINKELQSAKLQPSEWGFLSSTFTRPLSNSKTPAKYHHTQGTWTIKRIRVPEETYNNKLPQIAPKRLSERPLRPQTALESVVMSNVIRNEVIEKENPFFVQQSRVLGSRLSLEQFGVSQYGIRSSMSSGEFRRR
ncbi:hypothetical protein CEUSTIGMA_g8768.t1 [Chlamydomonas eustigma]|uniref:Uncharacterized protein n=1 Tax=Chlamydomonas eustigma TaxID=1157962 RepID=A0A250XE25_9CHLO|nr:hypothetical protein CEUSTIGMA_g8768.t1 [Chlamydomonas eustigma]|eukprot:GAX81337.1 hypothetical protein CEUSTIGMA_g8768.t1 [Chlamydomonas eustigma]